MIILPWDHCEIICLSNKIKKNAYLICQMKINNDNIACFFEQYIPAAGIASNSYSLRLQRTLISLYAFGYTSCFVPLRKWYAHKSRD